MKLQSSKFSPINAYYYNRATTHGTRILSFSHLVNATTEPDNIFSKRLLLSRSVIPKYLANRVGAPRTQHILYFSLHSSHYFKFGRRVIIVCDGLTVDLWLLIGKATRRTYDFRGSIQRTTALTIRQTRRVTAINYERY